MGFLRKKPPADGLGAIRFYADDDGELTGYTAEWDGDEAGLLHLPSLVWDEYLGFVRHYPLDAAIGEFRQNINAATEWRHNPEALFVDTVPMLEEPPDEAGAATAIVSVRMDYAKQRYRSDTGYYPESAKGLLFALTHDVVWNWVFGSLLGSELDDEIDALLVNMAYQVQWYEINKVKPGFVRHVGKAPFHGAMSGNRDRLKEEIAAFGGITLEEFENLPDLKRQKLLREHGEATADAFREDMLAHLEREEERDDRST